MSNILLVGKKWEKKGLRFKLRVDGGVVVDSKNIVRIKKRKISTYESKEEN